MNVINISVGDDLFIDSSDHGSIKIKQSKYPNNVFELKEDGIYMNSNIVSEGDGVPDQANGIVRVGWMSGYDRSATPTQTGRITANNVIHRIFTAVRYTPDIPTNDMIKDFRAIDCFIPGDMIRVPTEDGMRYTYYLITLTTLGDAANGRVNNRIEKVQLLGTW